MGYIEFHWVLWGYTGFYWVLVGFTWFDWVLLNFSMISWVLLGFIESYWVLQSFTGFFNDFTSFTRVFNDFVGFTWFYRVFFRLLPSSTWFNRIVPSLIVVYWVSLGFIALNWVVDWHFDGSRSDQLLDFWKGIRFFYFVWWRPRWEQKKALEGSAQSTPSNGNQLRRRGRNEIGALAPHHRDFQKKIHFFPFKNEKLNEMGITGRNPIKKRNRIHFFFQINVTRSDCFYFWPAPFAMAPLANGAGRALKTNKKNEKNGQNRFKN